MPGSSADSAVVTWSVPQCPFTIGCSARMLDDIRLVVTDAFFSLARGGLEIGGILLGRFENGRLSIVGYMPLECEHAYGPSFAVSPSDHGRMRALLKSADEQYPDLQPVGWYHSHTRSGIFLSDDDLAIYHLYFPEPWQVALVMKPHTFDPPRMGFFFREADGRVHASESYNEVTLEPLPMRQVPSEAPPPAPDPRPGSDSVHDRPRRRLSQVEIEATAEAVAPEPMSAPPPPPPPPPPPKPVAAPLAAAAAMPIARVPEPEPELEPEPETHPEPIPDAHVPQFATHPPSRAGRLFLWAVLGAAATLGLIFGAVKTRDMWMPKFVSAARPQPPQPPPSLGLRTTDHDGQLEIAWDRYSAGIRQGASARLEIIDGGSPQIIPLDAAHLQAGVFTYGRQSAKVDVKLVVTPAQGSTASEVTSFFGKLPERKPPPESEESKKQREELAAQAAKLKTDLNNQAARTRRLERDLQEMKRRMLNQAQGKN